MPALGRSLICSPGLLLAGGCGDVRVLLIEAFHAACGVHELLFAGKERMAIRTDFHAEHIALDRGTRGKSMPARTIDSHCMIVGVNSGFHCFSNRSCPVCTGNPRVGLTAASLGHETIADYTRKAKEHQTRVVRGVLAWPVSLQAGPSLDVITRPNPHADRIKPPCPGKALTGNLRSSGKRGLSKNRKWQEKKGGENYRSP